MSRPKAMLAALAIGLLVVASSVVIASLGGRPIQRDQLGDEMPILAFQAVMVAIPFLVLAIAGISTRRPWIAGLVLTLALWGYYLLDALVLAVPGRGANIGLGLIMLASPLIISLICFALARTGMKRGDSV
jgi:hypothetical protein